MSQLQATDVHGNRVYHRGRVVVDKEGQTIASITRFGKMPDGTQCLTLTLPENLALDDKVVIATALLTWAAEHGRE